MAVAPREWAKEDIPTLDDTAAFLSMVQAVRNVFPALSGLPEVPPDMERFTYQEANDIERILARVGLAVGRIPQDRIYSGELQSGGV